MDTGKLFQVANDLITEDTTQGIQDLMAGLRNALANLQSSPADVNYQLSVRSALDDIVSKMGFLKSVQDPVFYSYVKNIGGERFFTPLLAEDIFQTIENNSMTPAVAFEHVTKIINARSEFLNQMRVVASSLSALGLSEHLEEGDSQIGFRIPRGLFENNFKGWISELNEVSRIVRPFSEIATGESEPIKLGNISSTDPLVFLLLAPPTVGMIGNAISWALDQWKKVEEIKKIRAETLKLKTEENDYGEIINLFDKQIQSTVDNAINKYANELAPPGRKAGRERELNNEISMALRSLLARIERGMTVEIRCLPPSDERAEEVIEQFDEIKNVVSKLNFPTPNESPILNLPRPPKSEDENGE